MFKRVTGGISCLPCKRLRLAVYTNTQLMHDQTNGIIKILHHTNRHLCSCALSLS